MTVAPRATAERYVTVLTAALSGGRRARGVLDTGVGRTYLTDGRVVTVPFPFELQRRPLTCALALQASPTKEAVAQLPWTAFRGRQQLALAWVEGEMAARWAADRWPGLRAQLEQELPGLDLDGPVVHEPGELAALAAARARDLRLADPPAILGRLPAPRVRVGGPLRRTFIATRWSSRHRARRQGSLPVPVSGPGTEPVLDPGAPGTIEALEGRSGHELGIPYPEWDATAGRHRPDHVRVLELPWPASRERHAVAPLRVRARPARTLRRGQEQGDLDIDAVVRWRCDLLAGTATGAPRLHQTLLPGRAPIAWALLVDASASASLDGGRLLVTALSHAESVAAGLTQDGHHVAVFAFRSRARERVEVHVLQRFEDRPRPLTRSLRPGGYTRMGGALRHVGGRVAAQPGTGHVLLSLGDAVPYDEGYGGRYAREDVRHAVQELRARGVTVRHAALAPGDAASLTQMFGARGWAPATSRDQIRALIEDTISDVEADR
ncbi:hypothetical protein [Conexibacter sp. SYSU D00693]|uniref:hypothetical protein n=1 Tax=Conexibacter sp. SYSU D00693 TaxID=2812560 RepID=UPI00196ABDC9|nr:hypothetical protein [Conexibacter sp. SYSU D00693]